ncbi:MAG: hypothetical protein HYV26_07025 [Candidatus Hydrogenedentes bacterium]|nr:hypothetical protein [Candidatus Hydrogenedentota bacterium]MBI3117630.1 hypothetical protein [Candidatus Hydrogenedentota bacterium]
MTPQTLPNDAPQNSPRHALPPNANKRLPAMPPPKQWLFGLVLTVCVLAALEVFWRARGFQPSVTDEPALWALQRDRVEGAPPKTLVLLGRSRMLQSFVPATFRELAPDWAHIQLAIDGKHCLGTLRDIALNTSFSGVLLCEVTAPSFIPETWDQQKPYLDFYYTQWNPLTRSARRLKSMLQLRLTILLPDLLLQQALPQLLQGRLAPQFILMHPDRIQEVNYRKVDIAWHTRHRLEDVIQNYPAYLKLPGARAWPAGLDTVDGWVRRIQARGGRVVFLFPPTSGAYQQAQEALMPRARYWDIIVSRTSALALHSEDIPELQGIECAEGSHLFPEDCILFTRAITKELKSHDVLR